MKRRLLILGIFLLLGAVVNVAVAWIVARPPWVQARGSFAAHDQRWPVAVPERWPAHAELSALRRGGFVVHQWVSTQVHEIQEYQRRPRGRRRWNETFTVVIADAGFPFPTLRWHYLAELVMYTHNPGYRLVGHPTPTVWTKGTLRNSPPGFYEPITMSLPVRPICPGFALNPLSYAAILWLLIRRSLV